MPHYHNYARVGENEQAIIEVCISCKKKLITKKDKLGRSDNEKFRKEHIADFAQPTGPTAKIFNQVYKK